MKRILSLIIFSVLCMSCFSTTSKGNYDPEIIGINQNGNEVIISLLRPQQEGAVLVVAAYNGIKLLNVAHKTIIPSDNGNMIIELNISAEATKIKAFIWDGLDSMRSLCEGKSFSNIVPPSNYTITANDIYDRLDGSTVTIPLSQAIANNLFDSTIAGAIVNHNQTDTAIKNVIDGKKDLALVTYPSQENLDYAAQKGIDLAIIPVVNDAFVFIANGNNSVNSLTQEQLRKIYSNQITTWDELGGTISNWAEYVEASQDSHYDEYGQEISATSPPPILPFQRNPNSGSQSGMTSFMGDTPISVPFFDSHVINSMGPLIDSIADVPSSIGYSYLYFARTMWQIPAGLTKFLAVDGIAPTNENIANGTYPVITPYYAVYRADAALDSFPCAMTQLLLSAEGQKTAEDAGYVKLGTIPSMPTPGFYVRNITNEFLIEDIYSKILLNVYESPYFILNKLPEAVISKLYNDNISRILKRSTNAVNALAEGSTDLVIGNYPSAAELEYAQSKNIELEITPIAGDSYGFAVHTDNPVDSLTCEQLEQIYSGSITNWSEVGGSAGAITIYNNTLEHFLDDYCRRDYYRAEIFFNPFFGSLHQKAPTLQRWQDRWPLDPPYYDNMIRNHLAIGHSIHSVEDLDTYKFLEITDWDMSFEYYAVTRKNDSPDSFAKRFVQCLLSSDTQTLAENIGYLKVNKGELN